MGPTPLMESEGGGGLIHHSASKMDSQALAILKNLL